MKKHLVVALYLRISDEDDEREAGSESNSIAGQRILLRDFVHNHEDLSDSTVVEVVDDGYSGTSFERPGVQLLLEMAKRKEIHCIAVKDFSRFGRNYLEVGNYLEQIFPFLGIRFFSVNDHFDSYCNGGAAGSIDVGFKNILYEAYSKDLSVKIKSMRKSKAEQGKFVTAFAPYGYIKNAHERNKLVIDPECAPVVHRIFDLYLDGTTQTDIARLLNRECVLCPMMIRRKRGENFCRKQCKDTCIWTVGTVSHILFDRRYTGDAVYGKVMPESIGSKKDVAVPEEQWIIVPDAHEAIITHEDFEKVQDRKKNYKKREKGKMNEIPLARKIICRSCNHALTRIMKGKKAIYRCRTCRNIENYACFQGKIVEQELEAALLSCLQTMAAMAEQPVQDKGKHESSSIKLFAKSQEIQQMIEKQQSKNLALYEAYKKQKLSETGFKEKINALEQSVSTLQKQYKQIENDYQKAIQEKPAVAVSGSERLWRYFPFERLTKEMVDEFVEAILIEVDGTISIKWNFNNPVNSFLSLS